MSKFYDEIALVYDDIFPFKKNKLDFILKCLVKSNSNILDVACGSGVYASELAKLGHQVTAIDLDAEMIKQTNKRNSNLTSQVMNMLDISNLANQFDLIYSLGNSIVHLDSLQEIEAFFRQAYLKLKDNGKLLIQIINYDRILDHNIKSLATINNKEANLSFVRNYTYLKEEGKIAFNTILKHNGKEIENTVKLLAIRQAELISILKNVGFSNIKFFGDFAGNEFDCNQSIPCIFLASKD